MNHYFLKYRSAFLLMMLSLNVRGQEMKVYRPVTPVSGIFTPGAKATPQINGPRVFGVRPGSPFLYNIPVSGLRPITYTVSKLPTGLKLDTLTGHITGSLNRKGTFRITIDASNKLGKSSTSFKIVVGEALALTPPMGWNSYNIYGEGVDNDKAMHAANALVSTKLNEHGWTYINLDDGWQAERNKTTLALTTDSNRFSDIQIYCDSIHQLGLKAGLYSTPWMKTYGGRMGGSSPYNDGSIDSTYYFNSPKNKKIPPFAIGKYSFAKQDARQFAAWGFDYLKYDSGPVEGPETREMYEALRNTGRDIVFSLSNNHVMSLIHNINEVAPYAQLWRTTTDINDTWKRISEIGFNQDMWARYSGPGHFIDPDMLVVGYVGWRGTPRPTHLTKDEQYTHFSLWCLLSAPLLLGCDLEKLDPFTVNLLTNDEVIAIDQDELGKQATHVFVKDSLEVLSKPLIDGSIAVGLFNRSRSKANIRIDWSQLHIKGKHIIRDLWRQQDVAISDDHFTAAVASHGVVLIRITANSK